MSHRRANIELILNLVYMHLTGAQCPQLATKQIISKTRGQVRKSLPREELFRVPDLASSRAFRRAPGGSAKTGEGGLF